MDKNLNSTKDQSPSKIKEKSIQKPTSPNKIETKTSMNSHVKISATKAKDIPIKIQAKNTLNSPEIVSSPIKWNEKIDKKNSDDLNEKTDIHLKESKNKIFIQKIENSDMINEQVMIEGENIKENNENFIKINENQNKEEGSLSINKNENENMESGKKIEEPFKEPENNYDSSVKMNENLNKQEIPLSKNLYEIQTYVEINESTKRNEKEKLQSPIKFEENLKKHENTKQFDNSHLLNPPEKETKKFNDLDSSNGKSITSTHNPSPIYEETKFTDQKSYIKETFGNFNGKRTIFSEKPKKKKLQHNVDFYTNNEKSNFIPYFISWFHKQKRKNYKELEYDHSYIQWILPNHFHSAFNYDSYALSLEEAKIFRNEMIIAENLITSYEIMFDFYGMKLENHEISLSEKYKSRFDATLTYFNHNHLRIRRLLAHLNVVGFRSYAIKIIKLFKKESLKGGYLHNIKNVIDDTWVSYGEIDENNNIEVKDLLKNCYPMPEYSEYFSRSEGCLELFNFLKEESIIFTKK